MCTHTHTRLMRVSTPFLPLMLKSEVGKTVCSPRCHICPSNKKAVEIPCPEVNAMSVSRDPLLGTGDLGTEFSYGIANFLGRRSRELHSIQ